MGPERLVEERRYARAKVSEFREISNRFGLEKRSIFSSHLQRLFTKFAKTFARLHSFSGYYFQPGVWNRCRLHGPFSGFDGL